jgi:hypothetical protein
MPGLLVMNSLFWFRAIALFGLERFDQFQVLFQVAAAYAKAGQVQQQQADEDTEADVEEASGIRRVLEQGQ